MFGHSNSDDKANGGQSVDPAAIPTPTHQPEMIAPTAPATTTDNLTDTGGYVMTDLPHVAEPAVTAPVPTPTPTPMVVEPPSEDPGVTPASVVDTDDLLDIKQSALQELSPLVGHLDQSPEEKFRTTMMMIQASDDQALLRDAFEAAKAITDEKARAQALLDVVNEINYFTQQQADTE